MTTESSRTLNKLKRRRSCVVSGALTNDPGRIQTSLSILLSFCFRGLPPCPILISKLNLKSMQVRHVLDCPSRSQEAPREGSKAKYCSFATRPLCVPPSPILWNSRLIAYCNIHSEGFNSESDLVTHSVRHYSILVSEAVQMRLRVRRPAQLSDSDCPKKLTYVRAVCSPKERYRGTAYNTVAPWGESPRIRFQRERKRMKGS